MKTRRTLSNISFNSIDYFEFIINDLYLSETIEWAYWILHEPDVDDKKEHIHFVFKPSSTIDTFNFTRLFLEFPFHGIVLPRKPTSKYQPVTSISDWLLYAIHHEGYLQSKGLSRNKHYDISCIHATDYDALNYDLSLIDFDNFSRLAILSEAVSFGVNFAELIQSGKIPIAYRAQYEAQYKALKYLKSKSDNL